MELTQKELNRLKQAEEIIQASQELVNDLKKSSAFKQYVDQRKLHLIDSRLIHVDKLLEKGLIK